MDTILHSATVRKVRQRNRLPPSMTCWELHIHHIEIHRTRPFASCTDLENAEWIQYKTRLLASQSQRVPRRSSRWTSLSRGGGACLGCWRSLPQRSRWPGGWADRFLLCTSRLRCGTDRLFGRSRRIYDRYWLLRRCCSCWLLGCVGDLFLSRSRLARGRQGL